MDTMTNLIPTAERKTIFEQVSDLFRSPERSLEAANRLSRAYAEGVGHPEWHEPFGLDQPEKVAINLAGLYAVDTAANILAAFGYYEDITEEIDPAACEEDYLRVLRAIVRKALGDLELFMVLNCANLAWRAGQPFRDLASNPLNRIKREVNKQFNLLSYEERGKDLIQVREGARILLEAINAV